MLIKTLFSDSFPLSCLPSYVELVDSEHFDLPTFFNFALLQECLCLVHRDIKHNIISKQKQENILVIINTSFTISFGAGNIYNLSYQSDYEILIFRLSRTWFLFVYGLLYMFGRLKDTLFLFATPSANGWLISF